MSRDDIGTVLIPYDELSILNQGTHLHREIVKETPHWRIESRVVNHPMHGPIRYEYWVDRSDPTRTYGRDRFGLSCGGDDEPACELVEQHMVTTWIPRSSLVRDDAPGGLE